MNISTVGQASYLDSTKKTEDKKKEAEEAKDEQAAAKTDTFEKTNTAASTTGIYRSRVGGKLSVSLMDAEQARMDSFRRMLQSMVAKQGQQSNLTLFGLDLYVTPEDSAAAAEAIAPGGEYSVDAVATRILDMAKALSGGDDSKIALLRDAVIKGFKAAGVELGGKLPGICEDTYDECMKRFNEWEKEASGIVFEDRGEADTSISE